jgi:hypothetical protein
MAANQFYLRNQYRRGRGGFRRGSQKEGKISFETSLPYQPFNISTLSCHSLFDILRFSLPRPP